MKFSVHHKRTEASVLLWLIVAAVVIATGGCTVVQLRKWMRRMDGIQDRRLQDTNDTAVAIPAGGGTGTASVTVKSLGVVELDIPYYPPNFVDQTEPARRFISVNLNEQGGVQLAIIQGTDWERHELAEWFPVDSYGIPENDSWGPEQRVSESIRVDLLRSTNFSTWERISTLQVRTNVPTFYEDLWPERAFYRVKQ